MNEKMAKLLDLTLSRTQIGQLNWQDTPDNDSFETHFSANSLVISKIGNDRFTFGVIDSGGRQLESIESIHGDPWDDAVLQFNQKLLDLFVMARRQALRIDENLEELIKSLS